MIFKDLTALLLKTKVFCWNVTFVLLDLYLPNFARLVVPSRLMSISAWLCSLLCKNSCTVHNLDERIVQKLRYTKIPYICDGNIAFNANRMLWAGNICQKQPCLFSRLVALIRLLASKLALWYARDSVKMVKRSERILFAHVQSEWTSRVYSKHTLNQRPNLRQSHKLTLIKSMTTNRIRNKEK